MIVIKKVFVKIAHYVAPKVEKLKDKYPVEYRLKKVYPVV